MLQPKLSFEKSTFVTDQSVPLITSHPDDGCKGGLRMVEFLLCIDGVDGPIRCM
jgi:hypothetical protein